MVVNLYNQIIMIDFLEDVQLVKDLGIGLTTAQINHRLRKFGYPRISKEWENNK